MSTGAMLEERWNIRLPVRTAVILRPPGQPPIPAHTRDVSFDGLFVEMDPLAVACDAVVETELFLPGACCDHPCRVRSVVVRIELCGVALMFSDYGPEVLDGLTGLIEAYLGGRHA